MKNILIIATYFPPMGGVGTIRITKYVKYLRKFNWNPTVITISENYIQKKDETLLKDISPEVETFKLEFKRKNKDISIDFYKALKRQIGKILEKKKFDMVFITVGPFGTLPIGEYIYKKYGIKFVLDMRDPWKLQKLHYNNKLSYIVAKLKRFLKGRIEKKSFKNASYICTVNNTMTEDYAREYPQYREKFITISNGIDVDDYSNIQARKFDKFTIVYAGKFETAAGFRDPTNFIKAIKTLINKKYDIEFVHIGERESKVIDIARNTGIVDNCKFLGKKSYGETLEYCKGANILLVIGGNEKSEQTGKIFDYIGCCKPILVLANKDSEINKVCSKIELATCIEKNNIDRIEKAIINIFDNKSQTVNGNIPKEYTREYLTYKLVQILNKIDKG